MDIELAEAIIKACEENGVKAELQENYSASWMRGRKTTGVVVTNADLAQVITAVVASPQFFIDGNAPKFDIKETLRFTTYRLSLILY